LKAAEGLRMDPNSSCMKKLVVPPEFGALQSSLTYR